MTGRANDHQKATRKTGQREKETCGRTGGDINAPRRWTPTPEINTNTKTAKDPQTTGQTDGQTYYTATQGI